MRVRSGDPLVTVLGLSLFLPGDTRRKEVLRDIDLTLTVGTHCVFIGANGSGKSTLLRLLHGDLWPTRGNIFWHTKEGAESSPIVGRAISALVSPALQESYQRHGWEITGRDLLLTALEETPLLYARPSGAAYAKADTLAKRLSAQCLLDRQVATLSQGQMRLLLLARALMRSPRLLLLDECANGLDAVSRMRFFDLLAEYADKCTIVMTEHRLGLVPTWCTQRRYLKDGCLVQLDTVCDRQKIEQDLPRVMPGINKEPQRHSQDIFEKSVESDIIFSLKEVSVFIERSKVLHNITWSMRRGEHWQLRGANGSGKSTLLRLLAGDEFVAAGGEIVRCLPQHGAPLRTLEQVRKGIRLVSDLSQALYSYDLSVFDFVCSGFDNTIGVYRVFTEEERERACAVMKLLELNRLGESSIRQLSTGQLRCLILARAMVGKPEILLLDEPCSGLDAENRSRYLGLVDLLAESGLHFIFVSHYEEDAPLCINRWAHMENGRLIEN